MIYIAGNKGFTRESPENFSCPALREIDALWYNYPKRPQHFGFRVQKEIWQKNESPTINSPIENWRKFYIDVGWKTEESGIESAEGYVSYRDRARFEDLRGNLPNIRTESGAALIRSVKGSLNESLEINEALQSLYLEYSTFSEALRIISEAVQKGIDISNNERQDISQGQNGTYPLETYDILTYQGVFYSRVANCNL